MSLDNNNQPETKSLIVAACVFGAIMFGYNYFFSSPQAEQQVQQPKDAVGDTEDENSEANKDEDSNKTDDMDGMSVDEALTRGDPRVTIENARLVGSINLNGGIIDCITMKDYKETIEPSSKNVMLLTPKGTSHEFYYSITYNEKINHEAVAESTVWADSKANGSKSTVTLRTHTKGGLLIERTISLDDRYLVTIEDKIKNTSMGGLKVASASELVAKNPRHGNYAVVHEGFVGQKDDAIEEIKYSDVEGTQKLNQSTWFGYTDIYWLCALINTEKGTKLAYSRKSEDLYKIISSSKRDIKVGSGKTVTVRYRLYTGPKDIRLLRDYAKNLQIDRFEMAIDFGWFFIITKPLIQLMDLLARYISNMGLVILLLTLLFKFLTYPLTNKSFRSAAKMKELQPQIAALQQRYAHDKVRMNQELMAFYKKEKISPLSGCLPMLLQAPIFFCLYKVFFISIQMRQAPLFGWVNDLSVPDQMYIVNLFGLIDWAPPGFLRIGLWPLIMGVTMLIQQKLTSKKTVATEKKTSEQKMQENLMLIMPVMFTYICASFPVGVVIYWTISNVISALQQYYANRGLAKARGRR
ncbi:MAG: membrane protein insertase YidC [Holosporales bacterium]|jgi:YidC/Oxa1 family membrane protein insertase|nr:membrane protein insertase YidC [Holosporales bacterium]